MDREGQPAGASHDPGGPGRAAGRGADADAAAARADARRRPPPGHPGARRSRSCGSIATTTRSIRAFAGRRVEMRVSQTEITAVVLDTGELAARHRRVFAGGLTLTDPAHQTQLERQREQRRQRHQVEVEIRPLSRYDALIPA